MYTAILSSIAVVFAVVVALAVVALLFTPQGVTLSRLAVTLLGGVAGGVIALLLAAFIWAGLTAQTPRHSRHTTTARHHSMTHLPSHTSRGSGRGFLSDRARRGYFFLQRGRP